VNDTYRVVDISMPLSVDYRMHTPAGVKDVQLALEVIKHHDQENGDGQIVRALHARVHHGTHVDAPEHFVKGGPQITDLPLERFIGPAVVADVRSVGRDGAIQVADLEAATADVRRSGDSLLIRTDWTENYGTEDYVTGSPYLSMDAIRWCAEVGFPIVGLDFAHTKDPADAPSRYYTTRYFCENGVTTMGYVKGLGAIRDRRVLLIALPLAIAGMEASPVRAVVLDGVYA
jgi:arylformamidase